MRKKISIVIINKYFFNNYFEYLLNCLKNNYTLTIIINDDLKDYLKKHRFYKRYKHSIHFYRNHISVTSIRRRMWIFRWCKIHKKPKLRIFLKKSFPTFHTYLNQNLILNERKQEKKKFFFLNNILNYLSYNYPRNIFYYFLSYKYIYKIYSKIFDHKHKGKKFEFYDIINKINPNLILFPNRLAEVETYKILKDLEYFKKIKSFFIVDKWDNLGSKTAFLNKPNFLGLWGQQSLQLAKINHDFEQKNIFKIGSVRLSEKIVNFKKKKFIFKPRNEIIYLGSSSSEAIELNFLIKLNAEFLKNKLKTKIIYRIHPRADKRLISSIKQKKLKQVKIDGEKKYKNIHYIVKNSILNFSTSITTVSLESLFLKRPHYIFLDKNDYSFYSSYNHYLIADHYKGLNNFKGIKIFFEEKKFLNHIISKVKNYLKSKNIDLINTEKFDLFHIDNGKNFGENLNRVLNKVI